MKRSESTEMDRLLRRLGRRGEALRDEGNGDAREANVAPHMDADELSAFAEGALPEGARSRYVAHLADCDACRKLVASLSLAAGAPDREEKRALASAPAPNRSWRDWLAAIFSPPVLRYGVPALALMAVIVVALVATRMRRAEDSAGTSVAQNQEYKSRPTADAVNSNTAAPAVSGAAAPATSNTGTVGTDAAGNPTASTPAASPPPVQEQTENKSAGPPPQTTATTEADPNLAASGKPVFGNSPPATTTPAEPVEANKVAEAAPPAPRPAQQPTTVASDSASEVGGRDKRAEEQRKSKAAPQDDERLADSTKNSPSAGGVVAQKDGREDRKQDRDAATTARRERGMTMGAGRAAPSKTAAPGASTEGEAGVVYRSVGGRRFQKQGSAWVDTQYNASMRTTNMARGSEQYRALVADEPGLRAITQQISGDLIVVWKSRAYRFY